MHDSADRWNFDHPPGTPVRVRMPDASEVADHTVGQAEQWGSHALVRLRDRPGMWSTAMLTVIAADLGGATRPRRHDSNMGEDATSTLAAGMSKT